MRAVYERGAGQPFASRSEALSTRGMVASGEAPGKRPFHTIIPGRARGVFGSYQAVMHDALTGVSDPRKDGQAAGL